MERVSNEEGNKLKIKGFRRCPDHCRRLSAELGFIGIRKGPGVKKEHSIRFSRRPYFLMTG
jgi:hypothetical protein